MIIYRFEKWKEKKVRSLSSGLKNQISAHLFRPLGVAFPLTTSHTVENAILRNFLRFCLTSKYIETKLSYQKHIKFYEIHQKI